PPKSHLRKSAVLRISCRKNQVSQNQLSQRSARDWAGGFSYLGFSNREGGVSGLRSNLVNSVTLEALPFSLLVWREGWVMLSTVFQSDRSVSPWNGPD